MQLSDIFAVMAGQVRPIEEMDQEETKEGDTDTPRHAPLLTLGLGHTVWRGLLQRQAAFDRVNQALYAILYW